PVRVWIGPRGTQPPKDEAGWARVPLRRTDAGGAVEGEIDTPRTVVRGVGTTLELVAKAEVEGEALDARASAQVGVGVATAALELEDGALVPAAAQRGLLRVHDAHDLPVSARFRVRGDGLSAEVTTDVDGEAELAWSPPRDVGARRELGPCAGSVSASVRVERVDASAAPDLPATIELCVPVNRDAEGLLVVDRPVARVGDRVHVTARLRDGAEPPGPWSIVLGSDAGGRATSRWIDAGELSADVDVPEGPPGRWTLTAAFPSTSHAARVLSRSILVAPRALPRLTARVSGRAAPGGMIDVDADLADDAGAPLTGTVAAVLVDARGGGHTGPIEAFDTRAALCAAAGVPRRRCDALLSGDAGGDALRRAAIGRESGLASRPALDPGGTAQEEMTKTFALVMKSLEGGVFEASSSRERLADVGRKDGRGWTFNPEILSLATAALSEPPLTPGGEPVTLDDLMAVDRDVTFDHVARRVTRLKIFRVLAAVRAWRREANVESDEPIFKDPNALLRRLVREGKLTQDQLVDPWGGDIAFVVAARPATPFLSVVRGFELHAAGPDGRVGTGDDVSDPFERVLRSGTPYAKALHEDALVDAKLDAEVADATVSAWQRTLEENTGTSLGNIGHGWGEGTGEGFGAGGIGTMGGGGGHGRLSQGISLGGAAWAPPVRTDARGHARLHLQLGDAETTWRVALVALPDASTPATTVVDVASFLPASVRVEAGARWVEGDTADVALVVRNRGDHARTFQLVAKAGGAAASSGGPVALTVPARGMARAVSRVRASAVGTASLSIDLLDGGAVVDHVDHTFAVEAAAEPLELTDARWIAGDAELAASFEPGMRLRGAPRVVIERGVETALDEAIASLEPSASATPDALADALDVAGRVKAYAVHVGGAGSSLAAHAATLADHVEGRLAALRDGGADVGFAARARAAAASGDAKEAARPTPCPPDLAALADRVRALDVEPAPRGGAALACWDAFVSTTVTRVESSGD
ncbi:MAG TPA: alpha-2-macroglobulin family protein, partial [Byssovorax sp.]